MITAKVLTFPPPIRRVRKYWLKEMRYAMVKAERMTGMRFGRLTLKNAFTEEQPSTLACSSSLRDNALVPSSMSLVAYGTE